MASGAGHADVVKLLFCIQGVNPNIKVNGGTPFYFACMNNHVGVVDVLLSVAADTIDINLRGAAEGSTPLVIATAHGNIETVDKLLSLQGIDVNKGTHIGQTPLHMSVFIGRVDIMLKLLAHPGVEIDLRDTHPASSMTAADVALFKKRPKILDVLLAHGATHPRPPRLAALQFRRGSADNVGSYTNVKCKEGHGLVRFQTPGSGFGCDVCIMEQPEGGIMFGCDVCNYDVCASCEIEHESSVSGSREMVMASDGGSE